MSQINIQSLHSRIKQQIEDEDRNRQQGGSPASGVDNDVLSSVQQVTQRFKDKSVVMPTAKPTQTNNTPTFSNEYQSPAIKNLTSPQTRTPQQDQAPDVQTQQPQQTIQNKEPFKLGGQGTQNFLATGAAALGTGTMRLITAPGNLAIRFGINPANYAGARLGQAVFKTLGAVTPDNGFFSKMGDDFYSDMRNGYKALKESSDEIVRTGAEIARQNEDIQMRNTTFDEYMQTREEELKLSDLADPRFWLYDVYKSTMENAPLMAATLGVGAKLQAANYASKFWATVAPIAGTTAFSLGTNAVVESESAYNTAIQQGKSPYEAAIEAERIFNRNLAGNSLSETIQMSLLFAPQMKPVSPFLNYAVVAAKLGFAGIIEVGQERMEEAIADTAEIEKLAFKDIKDITKDVFAREITKGDFVAFILGVGMQGVGNAFINTRDLDTELISQIDEVAATVWEQSGNEGTPPTGADAGRFLDTQVDVNPDVVTQAYQQSVESRGQFVDSAQAGAMVATDADPANNLPVYTNPDGTFANIQIKEMDGQFASGFVANAGDFGAQVDFDYNNMFSSRELAYESAAKAMLDWVDQQKNTPNITPEARNRLEDMAARVREPESQTFKAPDQPAQGSQAIPQSAPVVSVAQVAGGWGVSYRTPEGGTVNLQRTFPTQAIAQAVADTLQPVTQAPQKKTVKIKDKTDGDSKKTDDQSQKTDTDTSPKPDYSVTEGTLRIKEDAELGFVVTEEVKNGKNVVRGTFSSRKKAEDFMAGYRKKSEDLPDNEAKTETETTKDSKQNQDAFLDETYSNQLQKTNAQKQLEKEAPISIGQHGDTILEVVNTYLKAKSGESALDARTFTDRAGDTVEVVYSERKSVSGDPEYLLTFATRNSDGVRSSVSGNIGKYGADYIQWSLKKKTPPSKKDTPTPPKTTGKTTKITVSDKSVRDNAQSATIEGDTITITNRAGRKTVSKTEIPLAKWAELHNSFGNPNANKRAYVESLKTVPPPTELGSRGGVKTVIPMNEGEGSVFANRIIDAQITAVNEAYRQWVLDNGWRSGFDKKDIYEQGALLRAIADGKSTVQELNDVLDRVGTFERNNIAWAVGMNPAASVPVRKRAYEMYKDSISDQLATFIEQNNYDPRQYPNRKNQTVKDDNPGDKVAKKLEEEGKVVEAAVLRDTQNTLTVVPDSLEGDIQTFVKGSGILEKQMALFESKIPNLVKKHGRIVEMTLSADGNMPFVFADGTKADLETIRKELGGTKEALEVTKRQFKDAYKTASKGARDIKHIMVVDPETGKLIQKGDKRPATLVQKQPLKDYMGDSEQIVFTLMIGDGTGMVKEGHKYLYHKEGKSETTLFPSALGLIDTNLTVGQQIVLDATELKQKGTYYKLVDKDGNVMGEAINNELGETVWHGSQHGWTSPDLGYVGTGEGNAAYGWGFYVTQVENIGLDYMNTLSQREVNVEQVIQSLKINGKGLMESFAPITKKYFYDTTGGIPLDHRYDTVQALFEYRARDRFFGIAMEKRNSPDWTYVSDALNTVSNLFKNNIEYYNGVLKLAAKKYDDPSSIENTSAMLQDIQVLIRDNFELSPITENTLFDNAPTKDAYTLRDWFLRQHWRHGGDLGRIKSSLEYNQALADQTAKLLKGIDKAEIDIGTKRVGYLYQMDIADSAIETMLLWDEPITAQPKIVREALKKELMLTDAMLDAEFKGDKGAMYAYLLLSGKNYQDKQGGSMRLLKHGVRGIKYKTGISRNIQPRWTVKSKQGGENEFATKAQAEAYIQKFPGEGYTLVAPKEDVSYNYVSFDVSDITVTSRNGEKLTLTENNNTDVTELGEVVQNTKDRELVDQARKSKTLEDFLKKQGDPYYHGTLDVFKRFDPDHKGKNTGWDNTSWGYFFLKDKDRSGQFIADTRRPGDNRPAIIMEAYVDIKNPIDLSLHGILTKESQASVIYEAITGEKISNKQALARLDEATDLGTINELYDAINNIEDGSRFFEKNGYDGIISQFGKEDGKIIYEYIAFKPDQIRTREELENIYNRVNQAPATEVKKPRFTSYENNVIRSSEIQSALNSEGGLYSKDEKRKLFNAHVLPKIKKLRELGDNEQVIFYEPATDIPGVTGIQYVNLDLNRIWHHAITPKFQVQIVKDSELVGTGAIQKDQYGERLYYPEDNFMLDKQNRVREKMTGKFAKRTQIRENVEREFAEIVRKVEKAESDPSRPSRFLRRIPAQPSVMGDVRANPSTKRDSRVVEYDKLVKRQEIAHFLRSHLDVVVRYGKYRKSASGIYKVGRGVIRLSQKVFRTDRSGGQLTTEIHEIGHHLDYAVHPFRKTIPKAELRPLLEEYGGGFDTISQRERRPEAFAEFIRYYITQPEKAKTKAPEFYAYFESTLEGGFPEILDVLKIARRDFERWENQPAAAKVAAEIDFSGVNRPKGLREMFSSKDKFYYHFIDDLHPIKGFDKEAFVAARNYRGWVGAANVFLSSGTIGRDYLKKGDNGQWAMNYKGKSFKAIVEPISQKNGEKDLSTYLVAKRAIELAGRDINSGINTPDAQQTIKEMEAKYPEFPTVANELYQYSNHLLDYMIESGNLSKDDAKNIRELNKMYVPFHRVHEEMQDSGAFSSSGLNVANPIKRIKGSDLSIVDPLESIVMNTYAMVQAAEANYVKNMLRIASEKGIKQSQRFEKVPVDMTKMATVNTKEIFEKAFGMDSSMGRMMAPVEMQQLADLIPEKLVDLFRPAFNQKGDVVTVMVDGKPQYYVADKELYAAINGLDREQLGLAVRIAATPARMLRAGAILSPDFMLRNPIRDAGQALIISQSGFIPGYDTVRGLASAIKRDDMYQAWLASGGDMSTFVSQDRNETRQTKDQLTKRSAQIKKYIVNPLEGLQYLSNLTEQATRIGEFKRALDKTDGNIPEAAFASRNVSSDYGRRGASTASMSAMSAFFNARIQGYTISIETMIKHPGKSALKGTIAFTIPSILLYLVNRDDPEYWEIPRWQKDLFWLVKMPNGVWLRIPKPFEIGTIFSTVPERFMEYLDQKDPKALDGLLDLLVTKNIPNPTPTGLIPIYENIANYSFFMDRPIVSQGIANMPPADQYTPNTSEVAKIIGGAVNYSPAKVDNLIYGYFATLGRYTTQSLDSILKGTGIVHSVPEPAKDLSQQPVIKAFIVSPPRGSQSESLNTFYAERQKVTQHYNKFKTLLEDGKSEEATRYIAKHPEIRMYTQYNKTARDLAEIRTVRNAVYESETLTPQKKKESIDKLNELTTQIAYAALNMELE